MANFPASLDTDATLYVLANQAKTYLSGDLSLSGGNNAQSNAIDVVDGSQFPTTASFFKIGQELIAYTTRTANKFTGITRGYSGTVATNQPSGSEIKMVVMAEFHNVLKDAIIAIETAMGTSGTPGVPRFYSGTTDPTTLFTVGNGFIWDDTGSSQVKIRSGGIWKTFA